MPADNNHWLERLKEVLRCRDVYKVPGDAYLIRIPGTEWKQVNRLKLDYQTECFYIDDTEFDEIPICVELRAKDTINQYWSLKRRLHRVEGPSRIRLNTNDGSAVRIWHRFGLRHREKGPAHEELTSYKVRTDKNWIVEWMTATYNWYDDGRHVNPSGGPIMWSIENGRTIRWDNRLHDMDYGLQSGKPIDRALKSRKTMVTWIDDKKDIKDVGVHPVWMSIEDLEEGYRYGLCRWRDASKIKARWAVNGKPMEVPEFDEIFREDLLQSINLFDGPFWVNEGDRMIAAQEMEDILSTRR